ncbi:peptidoglycan DD-metalloendopeptidase family protein [Bacillus manliponensis]|uniref:peptidoglycan DD-metalloendopeptidase family protein n=1 Tax=Bacillus manliponensis TaxID=574376 RepID=UPI00351805E8
MRERENKKSSRKVVHMFQKRWVFPTLYIACAAIILSVALWYQAANPSKPNKEQANPYSQGDNPAVPVINSSEMLKMPVAKGTETVLKKKFYDRSGTEAEQEAALVFYNNTYTANTGIDIAAKDGKEFDVTAALSGTVTRAEKDGLLGYVVTVDSGNGLTTFYQSLGSVKVEEGMRVAQGEVIGKSGLNEVNKDAGYHVHFEVRKNNVAVNPERYIEKSVTDIKVDGEDKKKEEKSMSGSSEGKKEEKSTSGSSEEKKEEKSTSGSSEEKKEEKSTSGSSEEKKEEKSTNGSSEEKKEEKSTSGSSEEKKEEKSTSGSSNQQTDEHSNSAE